MWGKQLLVIGFFVSLCTITCFGQVTIIAHKSVTVDRIEESQLLDFYTGDKSFWEDGKPVIVFDLEIKNKIRSEFYDLLGISSTRVKSIWMKKMFSGNADPPESFASEEEILKKIASTPGSIGFVSQTKVDGKVKILTIVPKNSK